MSMEWILTVGQVDNSAPPAVPGTNTTPAPTGTTPGAGTGTSTSQPAGPDGLPQTKPSDPSWIMPLIFGGMLLLWFVMMRSQRKEKQKVEQMQSGLQKHQRVQTIGGIMGVIVEVKEHEVVVKVDEASGAKIHFVKSAIKGVVENPDKK